MAKKRREIQLEKAAAAKANKRKFKHNSKVILVVSLLLVTIGSYLFYTQMIIPTRESERPLSILLVGSDVSEFRDEYFMGTKPEKTDSLIVLTFNPNTYTVDMTSIPRDTSIDYLCDSIQDFDGNAYEGEDYQDQVNELYQVSGKNMDCLTDSVANFLNINIDYYVKVNMDQLSGIIDAIDGIDISVYAADGYLAQQNADLSQTYYWTNGEKITMDGDEALTYARARGDSEQDYGRGIRQQQVIGAISAKMLGGGFSISTIDDILTMVETDMPAKLIYDYFQYVMSIKTVLDLIGGDTDVALDDLPDSVWLNLYDFTGFEGTLIGTTNSREKEIEEFIEYLQSDAVDSKELEDEMINNHQLYNSAYSSHFNVEYDQLYEVSNELRKNLELEESDVEVPSYPYGDNYAKGLMPKETTLAKQGYV